jgi:rhodanese-related sulfurtransferase
MLERKEPVTILDVRPEAERREWSIPGRIHHDAYADFGAGDPSALSGLSCLIASGSEALVGAYRWWRDLGYVVGAILAGVLADRLGIPASVQLVGGVTILSGLIVAMTYREGAVAHSKASAELRPAPRIAGHV